MKYSRNVVGGGVEILASQDFQAIPVTIATPGEGTVVKAGSPITAAGAVTTASGAIGILLYDVDVAENPNGAVVVQGIIDATKAQSHSGVSYHSSLISALNGNGCSIILRDNVRAPYSDATLSALTFGSMTLTPTFNKAVFEYTSATTSDSNTITATPTDGNATAVIKNGDDTVTSGSSATWSAGANTVKVTVTAEDGKTTAVYTVIVTKS